MVLERKRVGCRVVFFLRVLGMSMLGIGTEELWGLDFEYIPKTPTKPSNTEPKMLP